MTPDMIKRVKDAMCHTWNAIGDDMCEATGGEEPSPETKAELIMDASYMELYGKDGQAVVMFKALPWSAMVVIAQEWAGVR